MNKILDTLKKGLEYQKKNSFRQAEDLYKSVLKIDSNNQDALRLIGVMHFQQNSFDKAENYFKRVLKINPNNVWALTNLGNVYFKKDKFQDSIDLHRKAIKQNQNSELAHNNLATVLLKAGYTKKAILAAKAAIRINSKFDKAYHTLGNALREDRQIDEAIEAYEGALKINPYLLTTLTSLGALYRESNNYAKALQFYKRACDHDPNYVAALVQVVSLENQKSDSEDVKKLKSILKEKNILKEEKLNICFCLANIYERESDYSNAFNFYAKANYIKNSILKYDNSDEKNLFKNIVIACPENLFKKKYNPIETEKNVIFIVGMPRSGTSLVEQIIASHPEVYGGGELNFLNNLIFTDNKKTRANSILELSNNTQEKINKIFKSYINQVKELDFGEQFITDKNPFNFRFLGMISLMMPKAKIIHCVRNPLDVCISLFKNNFAEDAIPFSYNLEASAQYYKLYNELMKYWKKILKDKILEINYEELVADQIIQTKKILEYCDLDWDDQCVNFYKSKRIVRTASVDQVRKPIYKNSVNSWKNYKSHIQPLINLLSNIKNV